MSYQQKLIPFSSNLILGDVKKHCFPQRKQQYLIQKSLGQENSSYLGFEKFIQSPAMITNCYTKIDYIPSIQSIQVAQNQQKQKQEPNKPLDMIIQSDESSYSLSELNQSSMIHLKEKKKKNKKRIKKIECPKNMLKTFRVMIFNFLKKNISNEQTLQQIQQLQKISYLSMYQFQTLFQKANYKLILQTMFEDRILEREIQISRISRVRLKKIYLKKIQVLRQSFKLKSFHRFH